MKSEKSIRLNQVTAELKRRENLSDSMKLWRAFPELWLKQRFGEDPKAILWSLYGEYQDHEWDGDMDPLLKAWKSVAEGNWTGVEAATSTGKTYILSRVVYWFLDVYENALVVTSAPKKEQLSLHLWSEISRSFHKFKRIRPYAELTTLRLKVDARKDGQGDDRSWMATGFVAGVKANEESTTKAQGFHRENMLIVTEETPGMPWPTLNAFINTSTGGNNIIMALGNPDSVVDPLHTFITTFPNVKHVRVSANDHPNIVLDKEVIPGAVTTKSIQIRKDKYGEESPFFKSRIRGISPQQGTDSLIRYNWFMSCVPGTKEYISTIEKDGSSYNALGVDVANSESGDMAALAWGEANILVDLHEFQCPNANHLAYNVVYSDIELYEKGLLLYHTRKVADMGIASECIGVDAVGVGAGTVNAFNDIGGYAVISLMGGQLEEAIPLDDQKKPLFNFSGLRAQMYWQLAQDLLHRRIRIDLRDRKLIDALAKELILPKYETKGGKISIDKKEDIKKRMGGKSPNLADAFVYWNWMRRGNYYGATFALPMR